MAFLKTSRISKKIEADFVLQDINFSQRKFQKIAIAGETGSGKTTLLKCIAGLAQPDAGEIIFENKKVIGPAEKLVPGHSDILYLSQHFELSKSLRVEQVLAYASTLSDEAENKVYEVCQISHLLNRRTDALSGGERQRIGIARLLISSPKLLLLDEPFSNLDMVHKNTLKKVIDDICLKLKITCILVSHDPLDTLSWADKIFVMHEGQIVQTGLPEKIYHSPVNEYVAGLFGKYNLLSSEQMTSFSKVETTTKKVNLIRPENFKIVTKNKQAVKGIVTAIKFFGSHYDIEVSLLQTMITIRTGSCNIAIGKTVYVALSAGA